jgi:raffinose/stachyose/melibiose transport system substrate-binding protein
MYTELSRRQFLARGSKAALGAGLAGSLLAGCGGGDGGSGQVTYWSNLEGAGPQDYFKKNIEPSFEKANQGTDLKVTFQPSTEMDRLVRTALQGGEGPDIIMTPGPAYAQEYIDANLFAELDEYSSKYKWDDKLLGWAIDLGRYEDKLYAIPYQLQTMLLYYDKTFLEDKGMQPPKSRDELESMAEELQGQGITPFATGIGDDPAAIEWLPTVFWNHYSGPDALYQTLSGEIPFSDPVFVDAIALFDTYVQNGWFGGSRERFFSNGFDALHADLGDGKAAMNIEGSWFLSDISDFFKGLAYGGTIAFVGWARAFSGTLDLGREAHFNNASLVFSRASSEPNRDYPRWDRRRIAMSCWSLLATGAIDCERIIDPVVRFDEAPSAYEEYVDRNPQQSVKLVFAFV